MKEFRFTDDFGDSLYLRLQGRRADAWTDRGDSVTFKLGGLKDLHYWLGRAIDEMEDEE